MPADSKDQDLRDIIAEEQNRGSRRKHLDAEEKRKRAKARTEVLEAVREGDEAKLIAALRASGMLDGSPEFESALKIFRDVARYRPIK